jgi:hypothetical protein
MFPRQYILSSVIVSQNIIITCVCWREYGKQPPHWECNLAYNELMNFETKGRRYTITQWVSPVLKFVKLSMYTTAQKINDSMTNVTVKIHVFKHYSVISETAAFDRWKYRVWPASFPKPCSWIEMIEMCETLGRITDFCSLGTDRVKKLFTG